MGDGVIPTDPLAALLDRWRQDAKTLRRCGHEAHAEDLARRIEALEDALRRREREAWLGTGAAARWSGYSEDHLRSLAAEGAVTAEKRGGAWCFLRSSLPRKAGAGEEGRSRRGGGGDLRPSERAARRAARGSGGD